jgi:hypothetical protein
LNLSGGRRTTWFGGLFHEERGDRDRRRTNWRPASGGKLVERAGYRISLALNPGYALNPGTVISKPARSAPE